MSPLTGTYPYAEREKQFKELLKDAASFTFTVLQPDGDTVVEGRITRWCACVVEDSKMGRFRAWSILLIIYYCGDFVVILKNSQLLTREKNNL